VYECASGTWAKCTPGCIALDGMGDRAHVHIVKIQRSSAALEGRNWCIAQKKIIVFRSILCSKASEKADEIGEITATGELISCF